MGLLLLAMGEIASSWPKLYGFGLGRKEGHPKLLITM